jgi:hypothetical protein
MAGAVFAGFGKGLSEGHRQGIADRQQGLQERKQTFDEGESLWDKAIKTVDGLAANAVQLVANAPSPDKIPRQTLMTIEQNVNDIAAGLAELPGGETIGPALVKGFQAKVKGGLTQAQAAEQAANAEIAGARVKEEAGMESGMRKPKSAREQGDEIELSIKRKIATGGISSLTPGEQDYVNRFMTKQSGGGGGVDDLLSQFGGGAAAAPAASGATLRPPASSEIAAARAAIANGKDPNAVRQRLIDNGIDPSGL